MTFPVIHLPSTLDEATGTLAEYGDEAVLTAGCTAVTIMLAQRLISPLALVSLARISGLDGIDMTGGALRLGALVTHSAVARSPAVREHVPVLASTFGVVANAQVRAAATVGGVLAEADFASDPPACLLALDATVEVRGRGGERALRVDELIRGFYDTSLDSSEIITAVSVPLPSATTGATYLKYSSRSHEDRPCIGVAATIDIGPDGSCADLRVAVAGATEVPFRRPEIEREARGRVLDEAAADGIGTAYADGLDAISDIRGSAWYRQRMVRVWVRRAVSQAWEDARAQQSSQ